MSLKEGEVGIKLKMFRYKIMPVFVLIMLFSFAQACGGTETQAPAPAPYVAPTFLNGINSLSIAREFPQALSALVLDEASPKDFVQMLKDAK